MSSSSDIEHWPEPDDDALYTRPAAPAPGYDGNNGLQHRSYLPPSSPKSDASAPRDAPPAPSQIIYPQPLYYAQQPAHMMPQQPQYYSHGQAVYAMPPGQPQPVYYAAPPADAPPPPQYYTYATAPAPLPIPTPAPVAAPAKPANFHVYKPQTEKDEQGGASQGNVWFGRTKQQVEEDNMKIAKKEGAYDKRKIAPIVKDDNQIFWVCEADGSQTLRDFRYIKTIAGDWHKDPRYTEAYYFVVAKEEKEAK